MRSPSLSASFCLALCVALFAGRPAAQDQQEQQPAGHSGHGEVFNEGPRQKAYLMHGCGDVHFPVTCKDEMTQKFFDQGIGQLHGFWYFEAERSFRQVAAREPDLAMAYWGMAMANHDNPDRAAGFVEEAVARRAQAGKREQMFIDMLAKYYEVTEASAKKAVDASKKKKEKADDGKVARRKFKKPKKDRGRDLVRGYEAVLHEYPDDIEAMAFLANRLWLNGASKDSSHMVIELMLRRIFDANPNHPAHHYRIHLWDREDAKYALPSARLSGQSSPGIAHQWHMSGHIFAKLNRHEDAAWQQEASARVDHAHMMRDQVMPYLIHNYGHNNEWLCRSLNHAGQPTKALRMARNLAEQPRHPDKNQVERRTSIAGHGVQRLVETCRNYRLRDRLHELEARGYLEGGDDENTQMAVAVSIGAAYFEMGDLAAGDARIRELEALRARVEAREKEEKAKKDTAKQDTAKQDTAKKDTAKKDGVKKDVAEEDAEKKAEKKALQSSGTEGDEKAKPDAKPARRSVAAAGGAGTDKAKPDENRRPRRGKLAVKGVEKQLDVLRALRLAFGDADAADDDAKEKARKTLAAARLDKITVALAQLRLGDPKKARELIDAEAKKSPNRAEIMSRQIEIQWATGDEKAARATFDELRTVAGHGELDTPLLAGLGKIAKKLGYPADWRTPREDPADVGERPDVSRLGPFCWEPQPALSWRLPSTDGREISLRDYRGKPVLVIFYLGFGCLHCVEQLQNFHPKVEAFRKAGISIVAIGTDSVEGMKKSLDDMAPADRFAFPLVADPEMRVFKQWRCYDDFENLPLHGTFLIDGHGLVRWGDISFEPFDKADYLLAECKRLLSLPEAGSQR